MPTIKKETARLAEPPAHGQRFIRDNNPKGFAIRITATGARSYIWEGRIKHRPRRITLGLCSDITASYARRRAHEVRAAIIEKRDPSAERAAERREPTFANVIEEYFDRFRDHKAPSTLKEDAGLLRRYLPKGWHGRKLSDISHNEVSKLHSTIGRERGRYAANHLIRLLRHIFNCAQAWGLTQIVTNPARGVKLYKEKKRERFLSHDELRRVNEALIREPNVYWRAFFPLSLYIGTRCGELLSARWEDINLDSEPNWTIPHTKSGEAHHLPLPMAAVALLRDLPSRGTSEWVFPGSGKTGHLVEPKKAWQRIRNAAGVPKVRIHDLRRTTGSWLAASGYSLPMIGAVLHHANPATTAIYARVAMDPQRAALEANAAQMLAAGMATAPS
jgi:integrase